MIRNALAALFILFACLLYGAVFVDDTASRIAEASLDVHRPTQIEVTIAPDPEPRRQVLVLPDEPIDASLGIAPPALRAPAFGMAPQLTRSQPDIRLASNEVPAPPPVPGAERVPQASPALPDDTARPGEVEIVFRLAEEDANGGFVAGSGSSFKAFVNRRDASVFLESSLAYVEERRKDTLAQLDRRIGYAFEEAFSDKHGAVDAYADWFFRWGNTFVFVGKAVKGAASGLTSFDLETVMALARIETEDYMRTHYTDLVLQPELRDARIVQGIEGALEEAHRDYLRALRNVDDRLVTFIADNARYVEQIAPQELITVTLDWDAEAWRAPAHYARDVYLAGLGGTSLLIAGQLAAPAIEEAALIMLAPIIGEMLVTAELTLGGALLGSEVPLIGNVIGAALGLGADYLLNEFRENMTREEFEANTLAAVDASITRWRGLVTPNAARIANRWFDETQALLATPHLETKLGD